MNKKVFFLGLIIIAVSAGCNSDIVCTDRLKTIEHKCIFIEPIGSENPNVGKVLRDILEKEFIRRKLDICDRDSATIIITGSTFMTQRSEASKTLFLASAASNQAIESISLKATDPDGNLLLSASYDNKERYTATKLTQEFGSALSEKLK